MKCLFCENEFTAKRETAKYCSTNCRVKWHNKYGGSKSGEVKKSTLQVLVNRMMDRLDKIEAAEPLPTVYDAPKYKPIFDEPLQYQKPIGHQPTFQELLNGMAEIHFSDDKDDYAEKIRKATYLTEKQINLLLTNLWAKN